MSTPDYLIEPELAKGNIVLFYFCENFRDYYPIAVEELKNERIRKLRYLKYQKTCYEHRDTK